MKTFGEENDALINSFFKHTFFKAWRNGAPDFNRLGIGIDIICDHPKTVLLNLSTLMEWLVKNRYKPEIDFFSGKALNRELDFQALRLIIDKFKKGRIKSKINILANYSFLSSGEETKRVEGLLEYSRKNNVPIYLSALFDGKYHEKTESVKFRDDKYYDKYFIFNKKWDFEFHSIIHPQFVKKWKDNFLWFQKKIKDFGISPWNIYLSKAKNEKWDSGQLKDFADFIYFSTEWTCRVLCRGDKNCFADAILSRGGFDILSNPFLVGDEKSEHSTQAAIWVMLDNLTIVPHHEMSRVPFVEAKFKTKNNKIVGIENKNLEMLIGRISSKDTTLPHCEICLLKYLCQKNCLSSQLETTGDPFSPIPTVCKLEHVYIFSLIKALEKLDLYNMIYSKLDPDRKNSLDIIRSLEPVGNFSGESCKNRIF